MSQSQLQKLIVQVAHAARSQFGNQPMRIWWVKLGPKSYRTIVINTENKIKILNGPIRASAKSSLNAARNTLNKAAKKTSGL